MSSQPLGLSSAEVEHQEVCEQPGYGCPEFRARYPGQGYRLGLSLLFVGQGTLVLAFVWLPSRKAKVALKANPP